jgi:hypothetical protein
MWPGYAMGKKQKPVSRSGQWRRIKGEASNIKIMRIDERKGLTAKSQGKKEEYMDEKVE